MKRALLASFTALFASTGMAPAQTTIPTQMEQVVPSGQPVGTAPLPAAPAYQPSSSGILASDACSEGSQIWGSTDYLLWWAKSAKVPQATTGDPAKATPSMPVAAFGTPGTVLLNSGRQEFDPLSGFRGTFGFWLDPEARIGFEASGFVTGTSVAHFSVRSDANGSPVIGLPAVGTPPFFAPNTESAQIFSMPGMMDGGVAISSMLRIWGAEANGVFGAWDSGSFRMNLLGGFRYIDLTERLEVNSLTEFLPQPAVASFLFQDRFETRNQIYAGQLGAHAEMQFGRFFVNATGKVALGTDHESIDIRGITTVTSPITPFPFPPPTMPVNAGGFFAQKSNIGRQTKDDFVVVPEMRLEAGANLTRNLRIFVGYEFLYVSDIVRPGDQIDRTINGTQAFSAPLVGPARPAPLFNTSDFWMQGVSAGIQFTF